MSVAHFVEIVRDARIDDDVAERLSSVAFISPEALSDRLRRLTVSGVPAELQPEFSRLYGTDHPEIECCLIFWMRMTRGPSPERPSQTSE